MPTQTEQPRPEVAKPGHSTPVKGQVVRVRTRTYLVEDVEQDSGGTLVRLACLDDDAQGQQLEVIWELELDTQILDEEAWQSIGKRGFDDPRFFAAYIHTLRWNCVTATNPRIFQAPFRAGIRIDAYQLEPLRKALLLPRVNLFIADDVGLGKTIEAALIASELLLRRRVREIVVACPPSMLLQWKDELESRFGLTFEILDREYIERVRRERGYGLNPWTTFPRFLISHKLLIDENYAGPLRDWLGSLRPGSLLIFDEAHHAAPSSGAKYAIDSRTTRAVRDLAPRFEHRLFLSATPHNGHSNSFSALLELLDPQRFTRGVKVLKRNLDDVMVRRLKDDLRKLVGGFPERRVIQVDLPKDLGFDSLPDDAPELKLAKLLDQYREARQQSMQSATKHQQAEAALMVTHLQQRLLSSVEAFARTLKVHRRTMERIWAGDAKPAVRGDVSRKRSGALEGGFGRDDDRSQLPESEQQELLDNEIVAATEASAVAQPKADVSTEKKLLAEMEQIAEASRGLPDTRIRFLVQWIRKYMCAGARVPGDSAPQPGAKWTDIRLLIFTEWDDTKRYLVEMLQTAIAGTDLAENRIEVFHGPTPPEKREAIKRAFMEPPQKHPLRILIATDAAREGINLQAHCFNLFHFDVPWNPSRLEQRNGRIDRKLQPAKKVYCHYFVYTQRQEDKVLQALVRKTETIKLELGSLAEVLEDRLAEMLRRGIQHKHADRLSKEIEQADLDTEKRETTEEELEAARERQEKLEEQIGVLRNRINDAKKWIDLETDQLRETLSCSLQMLGAEPLKQVTAPDGGPPRFIFPDLDQRQGADPTWSSTLDTLRPPPDEKDLKNHGRKEPSIRPVVFSAPDQVDEEVVQLHLSHRVVQRLLGRFLAQGFIHHDLSRACLAQTSDAVPRVVLLGRLSLYGAGAVRLHEELLTVTAAWVEQNLRKGQLVAHKEKAEARTLELLEESFKPGERGQVPETVKARLLASSGRDIKELLPHLEIRGGEARAEAEAALLKRGNDEAESMRRVLEEQRKRVESELGRKIYDQLVLEFSNDEKRQLESNRRYWQLWLTKAEGDLAEEPNRILNFYKVTSIRIEPIGLAYLWPITG